jgi:hypothetical protein
MLATTIDNYAKNVVREVVSVGRAGTLMDWEAERENRVYACLYTAENILNWRMERINRRNVLSLLVLHETARDPGDNDDSDEFQTALIDQIRVLRLIDRPGSIDGDTAGVGSSDQVRQPFCQVEIWQRDQRSSGSDSKRLRKAEATIQATGSIINTFLPGIGSIISLALGGLYHGYRQVRNRKVNEALIQGVETARAVLETTPQPCAIP